MPRAVFALLFIFALNLVSDFHFDSCHDDGFSQATAAQVCDDHLASSLGADPGANQADSTHALGGEHACHFGHCGHLLIQSISFEGSTEFAATTWSTSKTVLLSRQIAPPYRPPIA